MPEGLTEGLTIVLAIIAVVVVYVIAKVVHYAKKSDRQWSEVEQEQAQVLG